MKNIKILTGTWTNEFSSIKVKDKPQVIISSHFESAERLYNILTANGFSAYFTPEKWPRDQFNSYQDKYVLGGGENFLGTGGEFVFGNDFGLASRGNVKSFRILERKKLDLAETFFGVPIFGMHVPQKYSKTQHIDTVTMTIPSKNYMLVDQSFYDATVSFNNLEELAKKYKQELVKVPSSEESVLLPLNCLVLEKDDEPFVIANKRTSTLLGLLKDLGIDYEMVEAYDSPTWGNGSIRCRTNIVANKKLIRSAHMEYHRSKKRVKCERQRPPE